MEAPLHGTLLMRYELTIKSVDVVVVLHLYALEQCTEADAR